MIPVKTRYEMHNNKLLAIVKAFKTWSHYLKGGKHKVFVFTDHNNLWQFMNTKSLSSCQVCRAQELFCYHFQIDYCQDKANGTADAFFGFFQRSLNKKEKLWAENTQILHCLQISLTNAILADLKLLGLNMAASLNLLPLH